jgi:hypothetical protein
MEWKVTRFCEFSSENCRAESPLVLTFCDGSQVWGYPSWSLRGLICINRVRQQKSLMSPVINGPRCVPGESPLASYWSVNFRPSFGVDDTLHPPQAQTQIGLTNRIALFQTRPNPSESQTSFLNR